MLASRSSRWAGGGICNGRQRLGYVSNASRHFSINSRRRLSPHVTRISQPLKLGNITQTRSLSLFGWGGSSESGASKGTTSASPSNTDISTDTTHLENIRTIKASHGTSDVAAPAQGHFYPPTNLEPKFIEDLQEKITQPHGSAAGKLADIGSGEIDITGASETIGYLKNVCGLDFGWGPSSIMEYFLEALHVHAGLSWSMSIITMAALLRLVMFKPIVDAQVQAKKMREIQPYIQPLRQKYAALLKEGNQNKAMEIGGQMREITKSSGVSYFKAFVPLLMQIPFSFGAFRVLRNAGNLPVPAFVRENWLWTTDLSFADPYYLTPAISSAMIYLSFRFQAQTQNTMFGPQMMKVLGVAFPAMSFVFMSFQPGSVQLYFMTTGIFAFGTTAIIRQQWFRNMFNLGPVAGALPPSTPTSAGPAAAIKSDSKPLPSNIQRIVPTPPPQLEPSTVMQPPAQDRSMIDRAVDNAKSQWSSTKETISSATGTFGKKKADVERDQRQMASARYQAQRQIQLEKEREQRNQQARGK